MRLFSRRQVSAAAALSRQAIYTWERRGHVPRPTVRVGGRRYYTSNELGQVVAFVNLWLAARGRPEVVLP
ncbi:MAG: MerR family transcriptional regulator [Gemmataceae bacterium]|nr:MerR family transcriptional regulator [Gemmataceae bacterium]